MYVITDKSTLLREVIIVSNWKTVAEQHRASDSWHQCGPSAGSLVHQLSTSAEWDLLCGAGSVLESDPADIWEWAESGEIDWLGDSCE